MDQMLQRVKVFDFSAVTEDLLVDDEFVGKVLWCRSVGELLGGENGSEKGMSALV